MMSRFVGESEAKLRDVFRVAVEHAPAVVIVDEIDVLCPARDDVCFWSFSLLHFITLLLLLLFTLMLLLIMIIYAYFGWHVAWT